MSQTHERPDHESTTSTPGWVKVFGIIVIVLVLLFVIMMLFSEGHGPGRHTPSNSTGNHTPRIVHGG